MIRQRPRDLPAMRNVSGIGEVKLGRYGAEFLEILNAHSRTQSVVSQ
jgi:superfamily II DNA helicase RecQ